MRSEEKKIIGVSFLILIAVIVWAVMVNFNKKNNSSNASTKIVNSVSENAVTTEAKAEKNTTTMAPVQMKADGEGVPVIMYHSVSDNAASGELAPLRITIENFKAEMKYLKDNGYTTLTMDELNDFLTNNKQIPEKSVVLTFDDGYEDTYTNVYPILKQYGFKATVFMLASAVDSSSNYLNSAQLKELQQNGVDIESGTDEDVKLSNLSAEVQLQDLKQAKSKLEGILNKTVNYVSYPYGSYNQNTLVQAKAAGYVLGLSRDGKWTYKTDDKYKLSRVYIGPQHTEADFEKRINSANY